MAELEVTVNDYFSDLQDNLYSTMFHKCAIQVLREVALPQASVAVRHPPYKLTNPPLFALAVYTLTTFRRCKSTT